MSALRVIAAALMFALAGTALAREMDLPMAASKAEFETVKVQLTFALVTDRYSSIKAEDKEAVLRALDRIDSCCRKSAADQMSDQDRVESFNDQEIINTIITHAAIDSRLICERNSTTGSHLVHLTCMTLAMRNERERTGYDAMSRLDHAKTQTCSTCQ